LSSKLDGKFLDRGINCSFYELLDQPVSHTNPVFQICNCLIFLYILDHLRSHFNSDSRL